MISLKFFFVSCVFSLLKAPYQLMGLTCTPQARAFPFCSRHPPCITPAPTTPSPSQLCGAPLASHTPSAVQLKMTAERAPVCLLLLTPGEGVKKTIRVKYSASCVPGAVVRRGGMVGRDNSQHSSRGAAERNRFSHLLH